jgi:stage V sporulation protein B
LIARGCFMVSGYLISVILARGLGPADYGVYGVIMSVLLWIEMVGSLGLLGATARLIPQHEQQALLVEQTARAILVIVSFVLFALCWALAPLAARLFDIADGTLLFRLAILDLPVNGLYLAYQGTLNGHRRFGTLSVALVTYSLTKLIATVLLIFLGLSVARALIANVLATVGALVYLVVRFPPIDWAPSIALGRELVRIAVPMGLYLAALQVLLSVDLWSLKILWKGPAEVIGYYFAPLNVARMLTIVPSVLSGVLFASLSWALTRKDEESAHRYVQGAARFAFVVLVPSCVFLALNAEPVMALLYSDMYAVSGVYLRFQLVAFGLLAFLDVFFHALMAAGHYYHSAGTLLALIPVALFLNLLLVPPFGAMGAVTALVMTIGLGTGAATLLTARHYGSLIKLSTVGRVLAATALTALLGVQIAAVGFWVLAELAALLGVYALLLCLLRELGWDDLRSFALWQKGSP